MSVACGVLPGGEEARRLGRRRDVPRIGRRDGEQKGRDWRAKNTYNINPHVQLVVRLLAPCCVYVGTKFKIAAAARAHCACAAERRAPPFRCAASSVTHNQSNKNITTVKSRFTQPAAGGLHPRHVSTKCGSDTTDAVRVRRLAFGEMDDATEEPCTSYASMATIWAPGRWPRPRLP